MSIQPQAAILPLKLRAIYVRHAASVIASDFDPLTPGQPLSVNHNFTPTGYLLQGRRDDNGQPGHPASCMFLIDFNAVYLSDQAKQRTSDTGTEMDGAVARIHATLAVDYILNPDAPFPTDQFFAHWGKSSALVHSWPYWREYCHSTMLRMNLPVVIVPLLVGGKIGSEDRLGNESIGSETSLLTKKRVQRKTAVKKKLSKAT